MNEYYKNLPRKYMGAGALFLDSQERIFIVKPTYKDYWEIPGGVVEKDEAPADACVREVKEELGLVLRKDRARLLSVDYVSDTDDKGDRLMFVFFGGLLDEEQISKIKLPQEELSEFRFVTLEEAQHLLGDKTAKRVGPSYLAHRNVSTRYLENGVTIW